MRLGLWLVLRLFFATLILQVSVLILTFVIQLASVLQPTFVLPSAFFPQLRAIIGLLSFIQPPLTLKRPLIPLLLFLALFFSLNFLPDLECLLRYLLVRH